MKTSDNTINELDDLRRDANEHAAGIMYTAYCEAVGGIAYNNDPLPTWDEFYKDSNKTKQSEAWIESANAILQFFVSTYIEVTTE
jgi:hypothetical protein|tara:strand:+ start:12110 stop:12364 length:255 start_codon:yes stop_codon:yes gene_type:complete